MHGKLPSATPAAPVAAQTEPLTRPSWQRAAVILFACIDVAAIGTFFAVFVGVVISPPTPRGGTFVLVAGGLAFAVLVMGQFFHWSHLALSALKERR